MLLLLCTFLNISVCVCVGGVTFHVEMWSIKLFATDEDSASVFTVCCCSSHILGKVRTLLGSKAGPYNKDYLGVKMWF